MIEFGKHYLYVDGTLFICKYCSICFSVYDPHANMEDVNYVKKQNCISDNEKIIKDLLE